MNKLSIIEQTPAGTNSIETKKPPVQKTKNLLEGYIANSWNGGILKPITYKRVLAGERIEHYSIEGIMRTLTPKVPTMQKLETTFKIFFVPNIRVWKNAEKYMAQKGGAIQTTDGQKIKSRPKQIGTFDLANQAILTEDTKFKINITDTDLWRDSFISSYIPRVYAGTEWNAGGQETKLPMWDLDILPLRGFVAIYNDMLRHKAYEPPLDEYDNDEMQPYEWEKYVPNGSDTSRKKLEILDTTMLRGRRKDSYYTNYSTQAEGVDNTVDPMYKDLLEHSEWQKKIAESMSEAKNEQKNDWDIVAEIRGAIPVRDGKVQFLGQKTIGMNYTQVSQTAYNANPDIEKEYQTLGQTGAYSYTEYNVNLINYHEFKEEGYIHVIAQTSADTIFETGIDRMLLNVNITDEYRPDLKDLKNDVLYEQESSTFLRDDGTDGQLTTRGYKRKWSEYFKLPNCINGDLTSTPIYSTELKQTGEVCAKNPIQLKKEFQFFEQSDKLTYYEIQDTPAAYIKRIWLDYTDVLINKNQAIQNEIIDDGNERTRNTLIVNGENQIFMLGIAKCITTLPLDESIKTDYKKWGES